MLRPPTPRRSDSSESRATTATQSSQQISFHPSTKHVRTVSSAPTTPLSSDEKHELARFASRYSLGSPLTRVRTRTDSSCLWENLSNPSERGDRMDEDNNSLYHDRFVVLTRTHLIVNHLLFLNVSIPLSSIRSARPLVTDAEVVKLSTRPKGRRRPPHGVTTGGFGWTGILWARDLRRLRDEMWLKNAVVLDVAGWLGRIAFSVERPNQWWAAWAGARGSLSV